MLATVVLLPAYTRLVMLRHHRDVLEVKCDNAAAQAAVNDRLIPATADDEVFTKRLAMSRLGLFPADEVVVVSRNEPHRPPPYVVAAPQPPLPVAPADWLMRSGKKLASPATRGGLMLLAGVAMFAAFFLFTPGPGRSLRHTPGR